MKQRQNRKAVVYLARMLHGLAYGNLPLWQLIGFWRGLNPTRQVAVLKWALENRLATLHRSKRSCQFSIGVAGRKIWEEVYRVDWSMYCGHTEVSGDCENGDSWIRHYYFFPSKDDLQWVMQRMCDWSVTWNVAPSIMECAPLEYLWKKLSPRPCVYTEFVLASDDDYNAPRNDGELRKLLEARLLLFLPKRSKTSVSEALMESLDRRQLIVPDRQVW